MILPDHVEQIDATTFRNRIDESILQLVEHEDQCFLIDRCAVSIVRLRRFVVDTGIDGATLFDTDGRTFNPGYLFDHDYEDHPVQPISRPSALAYCRWSRTTLPTPDQWMLAAYGTDGRAFPWGNDWDPENCQHADRVLLRAYPSGLRSQLLSDDIEIADPPTVPVDAFPHARSPFGLFCALGNVEEWCRGEYLMPGATTLKQARTAGGSFRWFPESLTRDRIIAPRPATAEADGIGFRCLIELSR